MTTLLCPVSTVLNLVLNPIRLVGSFLNPTLNPTIVASTEIFAVDWHKIFAPSVSLAELVIRGSLVYLILFSLLRFLPNRQVGAFGIADLLVIILFANAAQNAMSSDYSSLTDGFVLVATIIFWNYALNWLGFKFPKIQRLLTPPPLMLVKNGRMIRRNMKRELITESELMLQLRKQGIEKLEEVRMAFIEADGSVSIITQDPSARPQSRPPLLG